MKIKNSCEKLPLGIIRHIRRALSWINPTDLIGIEFIELHSKIGAADENSPEWHRHATEQDLSVNGLYVRREQLSPAHIKLFVKDLYRGVPKMYWLTPVVTLVAAQTIAHEVGHHLIAERGYVFEKGEKINP